MGKGGLAGLVSVRGRIYGGFTVILLLLMLVAGIGIGGLWDARGDQQAVAKAGNDATLLLTISADVTDMRRAVNAAFSAGMIIPEDDVKRVRSFEKELAETLTVADAQIVEPAQRQQLLKLKDYFARYVATFERVLQMREAQQTRVEVEIMAAGAAMASMTSSVIETAMAADNFRVAAQAGKVQQSLMYARYSALAFLGLSDEAAASDLSQHVQEFNEHVVHLLEIANDEESRMMAGELQHGAPIFAAAFRDIQASQAEIIQLNKTTLAEAGVGAADLARQVATAQQEAMRSIEASSSAEMQRNIRIGVVLAVLAAAFGWILAFKIATGIVKPLGAITRTMTCLAEGQCQQHVPGLDRQDEIGEMAQAVEIFKDNMATVRRLEAEQKEMQRKSDHQRRQHILHLADDLEARVQAVAEQVSTRARDIVSTAEQMGGKLGSSASGTLEVAQASVRTLTSSRHAATAAEQLTTSILEVSRDVAAASDIANQAKTETDDANAKMTQLAQAADRIGEVVQLITDIAGQTNLLALNATIEAARAGEAGKGFAVVANEVKGLAGQTARATQQIGEQVAGIQDAAQGAVRAIGAITSTIARVHSIATHVSELVEVQTTATRDIASSVREVSGEAEAVAEQVASVTQASASSYGSAIQVIWAAEELTKPTEELVSELHDFLSTLRA